jgi:hypothetical protein
MLKHITVAGLFLGIVCPPLDVSDQKSENRRDILPPLHGNRSPPAAVAFHATVAVASSPLKSS